LLESIAESIAHLRRHGAIDEPFADTVQLALEESEQLDVSARPAKLSCADGNRSRFAEPVSRNRPGRRSRLAVASIANIKPGARCTSSAANNPSTESTNPAGSDRAARHTGSSSSVTSLPPRVRAMAIAGVLLPTCLAP